MYKESTQFDKSVQSDQEITTRSQAWKPAFGVWRTLNTICTWVVLQNSQVLKHFSSPSVFFFLVRHPLIFRVSEGFL